ncbi:MAG: Uma2 family endonuclease [Methylococcales bacterium]|nr:Uma2 family endonuclease [Methylococcales bacterium]
MSAVRSECFISMDDYLSGELLADRKHEYVDGAIYAMAGASKNHQSIADNVLVGIHQHLRGTPCRPYGADIKVKAGQQFFYPDVMVVCEDKTNNPYYTESPILVVEVLSKATRRNDQTIKRAAYQALPSVREYVLIEQDFVDVEICRRSSGWVSNHYYLGDEAWLESIGLHLAVSEIYRWVENEDMVAYLQSAAQIAVGEQSG